MWDARQEVPTTTAIAGVHVSCIEYLYETEAALIAWDLQDAPTIEQGIPSPAGRPGIAIHVHHILLPYMGMPIVDHVDAEDLALACAEEGRWTFQFVAAPLVIPRASGSPLNPLAIL